MTQIEGLCIGSVGLETGGILIGHYLGPRIAVVRQALPPPPDSVRTGCSFLRGTDGLDEVLREHWNEDERLYYLGEWHYHPIGSHEPSETDVRQMRRIAQDEGATCPEAMLIIAAQRSSGGVGLGVTLHSRSGELVEFAESLKDSLGLFEPSI